MGHRNDGNIQLFRFGLFTLVICWLICGGATGYSLNNFIPTEYRPWYNVRFPICLETSGNISGYGRGLINQDGGLHFMTSTSQDSEIGFTIWYPHKDWA